MNHLIGLAIGGILGIAIVYIWKLASYKILKRKLKKQWAEEDRQWAMNTMEEVELALRLQQVILEFRLLIRHSNRQ